MMTNTGGSSPTRAALPMRYPWDEWLFTIYERYFPNPYRPHYLPYLRPYEATSLCHAESSGGSVELQMTVDAKFAHMRHLRPDEFEREKQARCVAYTQLPLEEAARYDARMCVYSYPGRVFTVNEFLRLPIGLLLRDQQDDAQVCKQYWLTFMQEISALEAVMAACGPTIIPDAEEVVRCNLAAFFRACHRFVRIGRWDCCDVAIPAHHYNAPNAFLIFVREELEAGYFFQPGATLEENRTLLQEYGVLIDEYLYYEEMANKVQICRAIEQGGAAADEARRLWKDAIERGNLRYPRSKLLALESAPFWQIV